MRTGRGQFLKGSLGSDLAGECLRIQGDLFLVSTILRVVTVSMGNAGTLVDSSTRKHENVHNHHAPGWL